MAVSGDGHALPAAVGGKGEERYEYCYDTSDNSSCDGSWNDVGSSTSVLISDLSEGTTYYWPVKAVNTSGSTEADAYTWWNFTTMRMEIFLPVVNNSDEQIMVVPG